MKLFLIIPTLKQGGAERVMSELANQFSKIENVEVHLVLLAKSENFYDINEMVVIHRFGFENKSILSKMFSELKTFFKLRKLLAKHKPDAVLSFMEKYNVFTIIASGFLGLKVFVSDRSNPLKTVPKATEVLRRITYRFADGIIAQTAFAKEIQESKTKNKNIKVIPNPVKEIKIYPSIRKEKIILNVGRLVTEKGQKYLLEAFSKLKYSDWKVVILGDGPLRNELENQIIQLGLEDRVQLLGAVKNVDEWFARSSIFVFSSISEGFPNALVEAMSAGLPCISFDCNAGPKDIIKDGENGFLIETGNVDDLMRKLKLIIEDETTRNRIRLKAIDIKNDLVVSTISMRYLDFLKG